MIPLLKHRLEEIKTRVAAASPGPWSYEGRFDAWKEDMVDDHIAGPEFFDGLGNDHNSVARRVTLQGNGKFISGSRADVPFLLEALETALGALEEIAGEDFRGNRPNSAVKAFRTLADIQKLAEEK